jgi:hypothetical protein
MDDDLKWNLKLAVGKMNIAPRYVGKCTVVSDNFGRIFNHYIIYYLVFHLLLIPLGY